jgi:ubiquinone biosynthesis protein UbiJ
MWSPFSFLSDLVGSRGGGGAGFAAPQAPLWMVDGTQQRLLLLLNHVLMQEPEATRRLAQAKGRTLLLRWGRFSMMLVVTAAGLFDRVLDGAGGPATGFGADLRLELAEEAPWSLARALLRGEPPPLQIQGDVQLASEIHWLIDHVRWDIEEDLSRLIGDAPARALGAIAQRAVRVLREFAPGAASGKGGAGAAGAAVDPLARR